MPLKRFENNPNNEYILTEEGNLQSREVAEKYIYNKNRDKYTKPWGAYKVHHIDGDTFNNSVKNLYICTKEEHNLIHNEQIRRKKRFENSNQIDTFLINKRAEGNTKLEFPKKKETIISDIPLISLKEINFSRGYEPQQKTEKRNPKLKENLARELKEKERERIILEEKRKREIQEEKREKEKREREKKRKKNKRMTIWFILGIVLIIIILILLFSNNKKEDNSKNDLELIIQSFNGTDWYAQGDSSPIVKDFCTKVCSPLKLSSYGGSHTIKIINCDCGEERWFDYENNILKEISFEQYRKKLEDYQNNLLIVQNNGSRIMIANNQNKNISVNVRYRLYSSALGVDITEVETFKVSANSERTFNPYKYASFGCTDELCNLDITSYSEI